MGSKWGDSPNGPDEDVDEVPTDEGFLNVQLEDFSPSMTDLRLSTLEAKNAVLEERLRRQRRKERLSFYGMAFLAGLILYKLHSLTDAQRSWNDVLDGDRSRVHRLEDRLNETRGWAWRAKADVVKIYGIIFKLHGHLGDEEEASDELSTD